MYEGISGLVTIRLLRVNLLGSLSDKDEATTFSLDCIPDPTSDGTGEGEKNDVFSSSGWIL